MKGIGSKIGNIRIGQLQQPKGGVFAGRYIPKAKLNDENWLKVLELGKPPEDGLYIPRDAVKNATRKRPKKPKQGLLYTVAKAMATYDSKKSSNAKKSQPPKPSPEPAAKLPATQVLQIEDWNAFSPDIESSHLGLEQLGHGESLGIIGAGITGLTLAWILNRSRPDIRITIYDRNPDVGGWMGSHSVELPGVARHTVFESGPRTLLPSHPGSEVVTRILYEIGKRDELMAGVPKNSPINQKALICNGRVEQLPNSLPATVRFLASSPILKGARIKALRDLWNPARSPDIDDESVRSFFARRLGAPLADRMASALMRGIYAADADKLSARSVARLNRLYYLERTEQMSIIGAMFSGSLKYLDQYSKTALPLLFDALAPAARGKAEDRHLINAKNPVPKFSLYGFKGGIQEVARAIAADLRKRKNVDIRLGTGVTSVDNHSGRKVELSLGDGTAQQKNVVVSTVAKPSLFANASSELAKDLQEVKYSSLAVVNVWVPDETAAKDWFGILVPKSEDKWNADGIIGVIFDSSVRNAMTADPKAREVGSNMTVMMGGDLWRPGTTPEEAKESALRGLVKMGLLTDASVADAVVRVNLQTNAIPLYEVGHSQRQHRVMANLQKTYHGRVALIGMAFGRGCGVSDCVVDALTVAARFSEQRKLLHPEFFFNHWWSATRPEYYA